MRSVTDWNAVDRTIRSQLDNSLSELMRLCAMPSVSAVGVGMQACAERVAGMLEARGFDVQLMPSPGAPVVYAYRTGRSDQTLLFYNHYDVQPPEPLEAWVTPPFAPAIRDGKLFARGANDDKGHIECRLAAIDALLAVEGVLPCNVKFLIEGDEEDGSTHLPQFVADHADLLAANACIWESGGIDHLGNPIMFAGMRGICYVELAVKTGDRDAHSGLGGSIFPNAAWRLTWALNSLKGPDERIRIPGFYDPVRAPTARDLELLAMLPEDSQDHLRTYGLHGFIKGLTGGVDLRREEVFSPTCTVCGLTSGYQGPSSMTVLPAKASAKVDFRLVPDQTPEQVLPQLRAHLDAQGFEDVMIQDMGSEPPARTDPDDPFLRMVADAASEVYGRPALIAPMTGGSGPNHAFIHHLHVPIASAGVGYPGGEIHAPNEHIVIDHFVAGVRHTARILSRFAE
jgi:acetylornithine deacetylase/succinyl-diaminopimelate desuccinylase-like protein